MGTQTSSCIIVGLRKHFSEQKFNIPQRAGTVCCCCTPADFSVFKVRQVDSSRSQPALLLVFLWENNWQSNSIEMTTSAFCAVCKRLDSLCTCVRWMCTKYPGDFRKRHWWHNFRWGVCVWFYLFLAHPVNQSYFITLMQKSYKSNIAIPAHSPVTLSAMF